MFVWNLDSFTEPPKSDTHTHTQANKTQRNIFPLFSNKNMAAAGRRQIGTK